MRKHVRNALSKFVFLSLLAAVVFTTACLAGNPSMALGNGAEASNVVGSYYLIAVLLTLFFSQTTALGQLAYTNIDRRITAPVMRKLTPNKGNKPNGKKPKS